LDPKPSLSSDSPGTYHPAEKTLILVSGGVILVAGGGVSYFSWVLWAKHQDPIWALVIAVLGLLIMFWSIRFILKAARLKSIPWPDAIENHHEAAQAQQREVRQETVDAVVGRLEKPTEQEIDALSTLFAQGRYPEVMSQALTMTERFPLDGFAWTMLGVSLSLMERKADAFIPLQKAVTLLPDNAWAHYNLGVLLKETQRLSEAEVACRRAIELKPDFAEAYSNLGSVFFEMGQLDEAKACHRRALQIKPDFVDAHTNLIFALDLSTSEDVASLQAERKTWGERHASPLFQQRTFSNTLDPERRLRIGYVSADFRHHAASRVFEGMLFYFDRQQYDIFAYSNYSREDALTQRFKQSVTGWRNIVGLSDDAATELIRQDQIDILVDLSGHTAGNRLLVFARKPAPIQITAWGHATGTGMKAIDVFFTDAVMVPPAEQSLYAESVRYLPCTLCYSSDVTLALPSVNTLPALKQPTITFGSFNRLCKITDATITLWSRVLQAVPDSRLILKTTELDDAVIRTRLTERLLRAGIDAQRIALQGRTNWEMYMATYNEIDIALDCFPQSGGITTLDGLLMGIPVVTLRWHNYVGRFSTSIMSTLGLTDWIAESEDAYVALAVSKARDREALAALRSTLRERFKSSVLGDARAYVRIVEGEYRELWRTWVQQQLAHNPGIALASGAPTP
jgi:protein O-GlcNAc transferase